MKKRMGAGFLALMLALTMMPVISLAQPKPHEDYGTPGGDYVEGEVIVCVEGGVESLKQKRRGQAYQIEMLMDVTDQSEAAPAAANADDGLCHGGYRKRTYYGRPCEGSGESVHAGYLGIRCSFEYVVSKRRRAILL